MKRLGSICCVAGLWLLAGCANHYDMTLTNGGRITNVTRPVLNRAYGYYAYKDVGGNEHYVSAGRVLLIEPHSSHQPKDVNPVQ